MTEKGERSGAAETGQGWSRQDQVCGPSGESSPSSQSPPHPSQAFMVSRPPSTLPHTGVIALGGSYPCCQISTHLQVPLVRAGSARASLNALAQLWTPKRDPRARQ